MNPQTSQMTSKQVQNFPGRIRTVALCQVDPDKLTTPPPGLDASRGTNLLVPLDVPDAIHAAMVGEVEVVVVDGRKITTEGLTALSFLMASRSEVSVYFYVEEQDGSSNLQPWDLAA